MTTYEKSLKVLEELFAKDYINSIIISSELGVTKPSEQMYKEALKELCLNEDEVIFVDDNPKNCEKLI